MVTGIWKQSCCDAAQNASWLLPHLLWNYFKNSCKDETISETICQMLSARSPFLPKSLNTGYPNSVWATGSQPQISVHHFNSSITVCYPKASCSKSHHDQKRTSPPITSCLLFSPFCKNKETSKQLQTRRLLCCAMSWKWLHIFAASQRWN